MRILMALEHLEAGLTAREKRLFVKFHQMTARYHPAFQHPGNIVTEWERYGFVGWMSGVCLGNPPFPSTEQQTTTRQGMFE